MMKKRHRIKMVLGWICLIIPWMITLCFCMDIEHVKKNMDEYELINANVKSIDYVTRNSYATLVQYEFCGENYTNYIELSISDCFKDVIPIAVNKQTSEIVRMHVPIALWQCICFLAAIAFLFDEHEKYILQQAKRMARKTNEAEQEQEDESREFSGGSEV